MAHPAGWMGGSGNGGVVCALCALRCRGAGRSSPLRVHHQRGQPGCADCGLHQTCCQRRCRWNQHPDGSQSGGSRCGGCGDGGRVSRAVRDAVACKFQHATHRSGQPGHHGRTSRRMRGASRRVPACGCGPDAQSARSAAGHRRRGGCRRAVAYRVRPVYAGDCGRRHSRHPELYPRGHAPHRAGCPCDPDGIRVLS